MSNQLPPQPKEVNPAKLVWGIVGIFLLIGFLGIIIVVAAALFYMYGVKRPPAQRKVDVNVNAPNR